MLIQCQSNIIPKPMGLPSCITGASIKCPSQPIMYYFGANSLQIWCQLCANPISIKCQSIANPLPIHCQSYPSYANLVPFLCKIIANPLPMQYQSTAMWCQSSANMVPSKTNGLTISHTRDVDALQMWCQWANPTSIHCKSKTNLPINHQSTHLMPILVQSSNSLPIQC